MNQRTHKNPQEPSAPDHHFLSSRVPGQERQEQVPSQLESYSPKLLIEYGNGNIGTPPLLESDDGAISPRPILRVVRQRKKSDCGVASLATLARVEWEKAAAAFGRPSPEDWDRGCAPYEIIHAAAILGLRLERRTIGTYDPETAIGIVNIGSDRGWHVAVLYHGLIFDTDAHVWQVSDYLKAFEDQDPWLGMLLALIGSGTSTPQL